VLVEREARLGGVAARLHRQYPKRPPYRAPEEISIGRLIEKVESEDRIRVYTGSRVARVSGQPGRFEVAVARNGSPLEFVAGAIVLATGWKPAEEARVYRYGYGRIANVVTSLELEEMMAKGAVRRPSDGGPVKTVALINVDSATDEEQIPYSGNVESLVALKQASYLRADDPERQVYVAYRYMHAPGQNEYFYKAVQNDEGIFLTRAAERSVSEGEDRAGPRRARQHAPWRSPADRRRPGGGGHRHGAGLARSRGPQPLLPAGRGDAGKPLRLRRFQLHLLSLRNPAHRHLLGGLRAQGDGPGGERARRGGCRAQGDPVHRTVVGGRRGASAGRRPHLTRDPHPPLHAMLALHRGVPV
jgi:hypothetical protein